MALPAPQGRRSSTFTRLLRHGFTDPSAAERLLDGAELASVRDRPGAARRARRHRRPRPRAARPGPARRGAGRRTERHDAARHRCRGQAAARPAARGARRLRGARRPPRPAPARLAGARHVRGRATCTPGVAEFERGLADGHRPASSLRVAYRRCLLSIAARDVCGTTDVAQTAAELADLATATLRAALAIARAAAPERRRAVPARRHRDGQVRRPRAQLRLRRRRHLRRRGRRRRRRGQGPAGRHPARLPPDADLLRDHRRGHASGPSTPTCAPRAATARWCAPSPATSPTTSAGPRPGSSRRCSRPAPVAGDLDARRRSTSTRWRPLVWQAAERENFVADVQKMRRRVVENIPAAQVDRELKLGPGGLRDVEFAVQLLQLVHGRSDATLRSGTTLDALQALAAGGYVGRADAAQLDDAYRFLRAMEHRIQLYRLRRTHLVPEDEADLRRLGRSLGLRTDPVAELNREWRRHASRRAAAAREALLPAAARRRRPARPRRDPAQRRGGRRAARSPRLRRPGRRAAAPGGAGLRRHPQGRHPADAAAGAARLVRRLRRPGRRAAQLPQGLRRARQDPLVPAAAARRGRRRREPRPRAVRRPARPRSADARPRGGRPARRPRGAAAPRPGRAGAGGAGRRRPRRRRRGRRSRRPAGCAAGSCSVRPPPTSSARTAPRTARPRRTTGALVDRVGGAVSDLNAATLAGALRAAVREQWGDTLPTRFAVIGMGRFGGHELGYGSDADVLFVHEPREGVDEQEAAQAAQRRRRRRCAGCSSSPPPTRRCSSTPTCAPRASRGPLVRTLASYAAYYRRWSLVWESQALLRAEPVAGRRGAGPRASSS